MYPRPLTVYAFLSVLCGEKCFVVTASDAGT